MEKYIKKKNNLGKIFKAHGIIASFLNSLYGSKSIKINNVQIQRKYLLNENINKNQIDKKKNIFQMLLKRTSAKIDLYCHRV